MPKADLTPTTTRRFLLAGAGALATAPALAAPIHPDADLIARVGRLQTLDAETMLLEDANAPRVEIEALCATWKAEIEHVIRHRAVSPEGIQAKAQLMWDLLPLNLDGTPLHDYPSDRLIWSLVRDLRG